MSQLSCPQHADEANFNKLSLNTLSEHADSENSPSPCKKQNRDFETEGDELSGNYDLFEVKKIRDDFEYQSPMKTRN
jgi:hypothetical protein